MAGINGHPRLPSAHDEGRRWWTIVVVVAVVDKITIVGASRVVLNRPGHAISVRFDSV